MLEDLSDVFFMGFMLSGLVAGLFSLLAVVCWLHQASLMP